MSYRQKAHDAGVNRYRLTPDEEAMLSTYREEKSVLEQECKAARIPIEDVKHFWYKSKRISAFVKGKQGSLQDLKKELMDGMDKHSPKFQVIKREKSKEAYCLVLDIADIHIGKLSSAFETGEDYNNKIAVTRVNAAVDKIIQYTKPYSLDKIVLIVGNDILHTDTLTRTTSKGTPQDTDGMWYDNFLIGLNLYVEIVNRLINIADVHIIHNVSNHDVMSGWYLSQVLKSWFRHSKNVTFDTDMRHRKIFVYGQNLIGTTHNDGAKEANLPLILAQEFRQEWANTKHKYIYLHHTHRKTAQEIVGVTLETSRSVTSADGWHSRNGYQYNTVAVEAYMHDKRDGQIARFTAIVE